MPGPREATPVPVAPNVLTDRLGPHPYQLSVGNRCADHRFPRSHPTVGAKGMRSIDVLVCVLLFHPDACDVDASSTSYPASNSLSVVFTRECYPTLRSTPHRLTCRCSPWHRSVSRG
jgi:hypothetical protein